MIGKECAEHSRADMAIAINETGWPTADPDTGYTDYGWFVSEQEQSSNIVKLHVQALAHRLSFATYLGWNDFNITGADMARNMGLRRINGSAKPSYRAYRFMTRTIGNRRMDTWSYSAQGTRVYKLGSTSPVWIVWNALQDSDVTVDVFPHQVYVCDIYGTKITATPASGKVMLKAVYEPRYLVPVDMVESFANTCP